MTNTDKRLVYVYACARSDGLTHAVGVSGAGALPGGGPDYALFTAREPAIRFARAEAAHLGLRVAILPSAAPAIDSGARFDSFGRLTVEITRDQLEAWAGRTLSDSEVGRLDDAIPDSTIPDAVDAIVSSLPTDEDENLCERCGTDPIVDTDFGLCAACVRRNDDRVVL